MKNKWEIKFHDFEVMGKRLALFRDGKSYISLAPEKFHEDWFDDIVREVIHHVKDTFYYKTLEDTKKEKYYIYYNNFCYEWDFERTTDYIPGILYLKTYDDMMDIYNLLNDSEDLYIWMRGRDWHGKPR